jgi:23S rRNA pseudouridine1911/1915/1917 synthase
MGPGRLSILFADGHLIAADKPAGMHTAPLGRKEEETLLGLVMERYPEVSGLPGIKPIEPGLLHRLDRDTSGVVLFARTAVSFERLRRDFAEGGVNKEYLAAVALHAGGPAVTEGAILRAKSRFAPYGPGRKRVRVVPLAGTGPGTRPRPCGGTPPRGKAGGGCRQGSRSARGAVYETEALVRRIRRGLALVHVRICKGFRHQIRAHLAFLGLPILGDPLYGAPVPAGAPERMYLHALSVELNHPATGEPLVIASPMPREFDALFPQDA